MIPKQIVRRGLSNGTERLRSQFREAGQRGEASEYGGERIENTAAAVSAFAGRNTAKLLKHGKRGKKHSSPSDAAIPGQGESFTDEILPDDSLPQERTGSTRINTQEVHSLAVDGDTAAPAPAGSMPQQRQNVRRKPLSVKTKDTTSQESTTRRPAQSAPQGDKVAPHIKVRESVPPIPDAPPLERPSIKTREAVLRIAASEGHRAAPIVSGEIQRFDRTSLRIKTRDVAAGISSDRTSQPPEVSNSRLTEKLRSNLLKTFQKKGHKALQDDAIRQDLPIGPEAEVTSTPPPFPPAPIERPPAQPFSRGRRTFMRKNLRKIEKKQTESSPEEAGPAGKVPPPSRQRSGYGGIREHCTERRSIQRVDMRSGQTMRNTASKDKAGRSVLTETQVTAQRASRVVGRPAKQAVKTVDKTTAATAKAVQAAPTAQRQATHAASKVAVATAQAVATAAELTAKTATVAAGRFAAALAAGGGVVAVIVLVLCLAGVLIASPFSLFFGDESGAGVTIPETVAELNGALTLQIEQIQEDHPHDTLDMDNAGTAAVLSNWSDVLAIYAVRAGMDAAPAGGVAEMTAENLSVLRETFWAMNQVSYILETVEHTEVNGTTGEESTSAEIILHISISTKDCWQMAEEYGFTEEQREMLEELMKPEYQEMFQVLTGSSQSLTLSTQEALDILERLPDGLSEERRQVVLTACQLLGKVNYFWGGKSLVLGWDPRWGTPFEVQAAGSPSTGTVRPYGLDCSGFVDWAFYNVSGGAYVIGHGGGAAAQHSYCADVSWEEAVPGDLAFYPGDSHVGIVCGFDESGGVLIIHCASGSHNNVVVTGKSGFAAAGRPYYYSE